MHAAAALRLARHTAARAPVARRALATAAAHHADVSPAAASSSKASVIPLSNIEAQWEKMPEEDKVAVHAQLAELQKRDWKTLSVDEQKAGAYLVRPARNTANSRAVRSVLRRVRPAWPPQAGLCPRGLAQDLPRVHRRRRCWCPDLPGRALNW